MYLYLCGRKTITRLRVKDVRFLPETPGPSGSDSGGSCVEVAIRRPDRCNWASDTVGEADLCVERHTVLAPKTGCVEADEAGLFTSSHDTKPLGPGIFLDLDNESLKSVNLGAIEHPLPIPPVIRLDRVPSMVKPRTAKISNCVAKAAGSFDEPHYQISF